MFNTDSQQSSSSLDHDRSRFLGMKVGVFTPEIALEIGRCRDDFLHWSSRWCMIEDKETHRAIRFNLYGCQRDIVENLGNRVWLRALKARRLGITWILAAYSLWLVTLFEMRTVCYMAHKREYSVDFVERCKFIRTRLPWFLRGEATQDTQEILKFDKDGQGSWIRSLAATRGAADSLAADLVIVDEATKIEKLNPGLLKDIQRSIQPAVETANGIVILVATSEGPSGHFWEGWQASEQGLDRYTNIFWSWREHPRRDKAWYDKESRENASDPIYMFRQYPNTPDEAFSHSEGRVYPSFNTSTHVCRFRDDDTISWGVESLKDQPVVRINSAWPKWRAIDWGGVDPMVILWGSKVPGSLPALTVDPSCKNLIREMMSYRRREGSEYILDRDNHAPDCLRYLVITFNIQGHLHIYRELYIPKSAEKGIFVPQLAERMVEMGGDETFLGTVADRSRHDNIAMMAMHLEKLSGRKVGVIPHTTPGGTSDRVRDEIEEGIHRVNVLITGTHEMFPVRTRDSLRVEWDAIQKKSVKGRYGMSLEDHVHDKNVRGKIFEVGLNSRNRVRRSRSRFVFGRK